MKIDYWHEHKNSYKIKKCVYICDETVCIDSKQT